MRKQVRLLGILALIALMPVANAWAGGGDPVIISLPGTTPSSNILTITINCSLSSNPIDIIPAKGFTVKEIKETYNAVTVVLENNHGQDFTGGIDKDIFDVMTIVGIDNISGVFSDDETNSGTTGSHRLVSDIFDANQTSDDNDDDSQISQPSINNGEMLGTGDDEGTVYGGHVESEFKVYPNPIQDETNVVTVGEILGRSVEIIDMSGKIKKVINFQPGAQQTRINLSDLTPGIYMMVLHTEDGKSITKRIIKL